MHENHASIVALHRLKTFFKKSADTFASTQYITAFQINWSHVQKSKALPDSQSPILLSSPLFKSKETSELAEILGKCLN